jgi:tetratricopeptide (TPR) repeat protein
MTIAHNVLSQIAILLGEYQTAEQHGRQGLNLAKVVNNLWSMTYSLVNLGDVALAQGQHQEAREQFLASKQIREQLQDQRGLAVCLNRLGDAGKAMGQAEEAVAVYRQSLSIYRNIGNKWGIAYSNGRLGWAMLQLGREGAAADYFSHSLSGALAIEAEAVALDALTGIAAVLIQRGPTDGSNTASLLWQMLRFVEKHPRSIEGVKKQAADLLSHLPDTPLDAAVGDQFTQLSEAAIRALGRNEFDAP